MFCHECGTRSPGGSFCPNCGKSFVAVAPPVEVTDTTPPTTPPRPVISTPAPPPPPAAAYPAAAATPQPPGAGGLPPTTYPPDPTRAYAPPSLPPKQGLSTGAIWAIVSGSVVAAVAIAFVLVSFLGMSDSEEPTATSPGTSSNLDSLWASCAAGDFQACDDLYIQAPAGSDYEAFGDSCGNRNEPAGYCVSIYGTSTGSSSAPSTLGNDSQLDQLANRCADGDFGACDDLFWQSPLGSDYEDYGARCGYRNERASGQCVTIYGTGTGSGAAAGEYGSNTALDRLWDSCSAGNFVACDDLWRQSPSGSAYEYFGDTCGLRNEPAGFCEDIYG